MMMRTDNYSTRSRRAGQDTDTDLYAALAARIVGQPAALEAIVPCVQMYQAGLSPEGRPAGVYFLLGPSGTGKTRTVESLAAVLHGSEKSMLKVDCGEFQLEHEVAKLIGAPPGYLGHKETQPLLTQAKLNSVTSEGCSLALVLFDEIEKAAPSMVRLLLGVLDKATLRLGDNSVVNFERSILFLTSNLGAREMLREIAPDFGFQSAAGATADRVGRKLEKIGLGSVRRAFPPEFVNRLDGVITYQPLDDAALDAILTQQLDDLQLLVNRRLGASAFHLKVSEESRRFLLERGASPRFGARELKRTLHRHIVQPLAAHVVAGQLDPGSTVTVERDEEGLSIGTTRSAPRPRRTGAQPRQLRAA
jgi:ATP-dependent Clp protease ATP-binding subunit ClpA